MKIEGNIDILYSNGRVRITVFDKAAACVVCEVEMTPEQFTHAAMGRLSHCDVESIHVPALEKVGKTMEHKSVEFPIDCDGFGDERKQAAIEAAKAHTPEGWIASEYYGSQGSFFKKDGKQWARTTIRRWA